MPPDPRKYLYDMNDAAGHIASFTRGLTFDEYRQDRLIRSAVERQFEIIGEALSQLAKVAPETVAKIPDHRRIIAFRNVLIHGYASIDDRLVWGVVEGQLNALQAAVQGLLADDMSQQ
ncbi:MAG: DUF86 domain-containing protein [Nitrococcus sp.]|nr:DUF86 domain-containing protein [Nitrococcus sp.]